MNEQPVILTAYLGEMAAMSWKHGWELTAAVACAIALATTRSLLDMNAADRAELQRHLRTRYRRREARIHERNAVRLERLTGEIDALQTEVLGRSHPRMAM